MNTIEQAREVSLRLKRAPLQNGSNFHSEVADTIDALITELDALALDLHTETAAVIALREAIASIKGQEPVAWKDHIENARSVYRDYLDVQAALDYLEQVFLAAGAQERKPLFGDFLAWAIDNGYDTANTCNSNTGKWICLNPMTGDLWKAWQAAHGIKEQP